MRWIVVAVMILGFTVAVFAQQPATPQPLTKQQIEQRIQEIAVEEQYLRLQIEKRELSRQYQDILAKEKAEQKPSPAAAKPK